MSRSFFVRVCMFTVSNALLMSSATAMVRAGGISVTLSLLVLGLWVAVLAILGSSTWITSPLPIGDAVGP